MITSKHMMFIIFLMIMGKIISMGVEGSYWDTDKSEQIVNDITGYDVADLKGIGGVIKGGSGFLFNTFPQLMSWDYSFFQTDIYGLGFLLGLARIVCIIVFTGALMWGCLTQFQSYMIPAMLGSGLIYGIATSL